MQEEIEKTNQIATVHNLIVNNVTTRIDPPIKGEHHAILKKKLGYQPEESFWMTRNSKFWDGWISTLCFDRARCRCVDKKEGMHFPTGSLSIVREYFNQNGISYVIDDIRPKVVKAKKFSTSDSVSLRDYQKRIVDSAVKKGRGIIKAATGAGKTIISAAIIAELDVVPAVFLVTSRDLMHQARKELSAVILENGKSANVGAIGGGVFEPSDITIMTVQTAVRALGGSYKKYDEEEDIEEDSAFDDHKKDTIRKLIKTCKVMISDEVQHWSAETCQIVSNSMGEARYRFGVSATPWRDQGDDILIDGCFGKPVAEVSASELIKSNVLVKPSIYFIPLSSNMGGSYQDVYKKCIVQNDQRNHIITSMAEQLYKANRKILILVRIIEHGKMLEKMIPNSVFISGETDKKKRDGILEKMRAGYPGIVIASTIFDEGIDVRPLDALILAGAGKSPTRALQRIGRVIRSNPGKKDAIVIDFFDDVKYLRAHSKKREKLYRSESEFAVNRIGKDVDLFSGIKR
jgi:superfamily II DNA or RNA helicase